LIDYDAELKLHNERLRAAYNIRPTDRVLDIGCATGRTTREAARRILAPAGFSAVAFADVEARAPEAAE
jgi:cyclopropane fatty-acyl-phospholipid synthase-like methyltransferase